MSIRLLSLLLFLAIAGGISPQNVFAQSGPVTVQATPFYRFITQNATLGHFLTANFSEGTGNPYNYAYQPFPFQADIVVGPAGYTPRAGQGLVPLYRWQVDERPRIYYYYSIYYANHGSNYRFQGIAGYVFPAGGPGTPLHFWYSQSYGYYYTLNNEYPPCCTFSYHGVPFHLPQGGSFIFDPPPDPCPGMEAQRDECFSTGGNWIESGCYCQYFEENPCRPGMDCGVVLTPTTEQQEVPPQ